MAFVLDQRRTAEPSLTRPAEIGGNRHSASSMLPSTLAGRLIGLGLTGLVHLALLLLLILNVFGRQEVSPKPGGPGLQVIDLPAFLAQQPEPTPPAPSTAQSAAPNEAEKPEARTAEWSRSKLAVARPAASAAAIVAASPPGLPGMAGGAGGGSDYDPYAGAAPLRTWNASSVTALPPAPGVDQSDTNLILGGKLVAMARSRWPALRGTCTFILSLDAHGQISAVKWKGGTLSSGARAQIQSLLLDRELGQVGPANANVTLGPLVL